MAAAARPNFKPQNFYRMRPPEGKAAERYCFVAMVLATHWLLLLHISPKDTAGRPHGQGLVGLLGTRVRSVFDSGRLFS